jgi:hypothetical protein
MSAQRKASIRELASAAYELRLGVTEGTLQPDGQGGWLVGDRPLQQWLSEYQGQEIMLIVASMEDNRPVPTKLCRTCGTQYTGIECPHCREARIRLRGR